MRRVEEEEVVEEEEREGVSNWKTARSKRREVSFSGRAKRFEKRGDNRVSLRTTHWIGFKMLSLRFEKRPVEVLLHREVVGDHPEQQRAVSESVLVVALRPLPALVVDVTESVEDEEMDLKSESRAEAGQRWEVEGSEPEEEELD